MAPTRYIGQDDVGARLNLETRNISVMPVFIHSILHDKRQTHFVYTTRVKWLTLKCTAGLHLKHTGKTTQPSQTRHNSLQPCRDSKPFWTFKPVTKNI